MLTPEQARDLVAWAGSQRRAAAVAGVAQSTVFYWLKPEARRADYPKSRARQRERYQADPGYRERKLEANRRYYHDEDVIQRNKRLLRTRRIKALQRRAQRHRRGAT